MFNFKLTSKLLSLIALSLLLICYCNVKAESNSKDELHVLFIGNSLTYSNDLPAIVQALANAAGEKKFSYRSIAFPDFSLEDHWKQGDAKKEISKGGWDIVVLQQGPSASTEGRTLLLQYSKLFANEIRKNGAKPAFYMVWPTKNRRQSDFNSSIESYRLAAKEENGILFPVGDAFLSVINLDSNLTIFTADGFHPNINGSYLAALVIFQKIYGRLPEPLPLKLKLQQKGELTIDLNREQLETIKKVSFEANKKFDTLK